MSENLGSGIYLDKSLDFDIDETGDIRDANGIEEVEKDLSFQMIFSLSQYIGEAPTPEVEAEIKRTTYRVAIADVRVSSVERESIAVNWAEDMKQFDVEVPTTVDTGEEYELVFEI